MTGIRTNVHSWHTAVGIDVGGVRKGFHAVAMQGGVFGAKLHSTDEAAVVRWCVERGAAEVAVDAPCKWSLVGSSRHVERQLKVWGARIHCFSTPTRGVAAAHQKAFYRWVFNGENLYEKNLRAEYTLYDGAGPAIMCALARQVLPAKPKSSVRRNALQGESYDTGTLSNVDFVDAALCAIAADAFIRASFQSFGDLEEGLLLVPYR